MNILIAGGSGFVGKHLTAFLQRNGHQVTVLTRSKTNNANYIQWDGVTVPSTLKADIIINLCGQGIGDKRWTNTYKKQLLDSRLQPTRGIVNFIKAYAEEKKPRLLNASAIGYYTSSDNPQTETQPAACDPTLFSYQLTQAWEDCAIIATQYNASVSCLRFGVVLEKNGGVLKKILPLFKLGLGSILGPSENYMSWIHAQDLCQAIHFIMQLEKPKNIYNLTAPNPCTQKEFADALANACHRPRLFHTPSCIIKGAFGQMGKELLLADQKIMPEALQEAGFTFHYPTIKAATEGVLGS